VKICLRFFALFSFALSLYSAAAGTWSDTFSQGMLAAEWRGDTNAFWISNNALYGESADPVSESPLYILQVGNNWSNYVVSCSINLLSPNTRVCTKGALVLRRSGNEGYVFALHEPTQTIELYRLSNHEMLLSKAASIRYKQWYKVRAELQGDSLSLWVDDAFIGTVTDSRSPGGAVGIAVQDAEAVVFDDFSVTGTDIPNNDAGPLSSWYDEFSGDFLAAQYHGDTADFSLSNKTLRGISISGPLTVGPLNTLEIGNNWSNFLISSSINLVRPQLRKCSKGALILRHSGDDGYVFALHEPTQTIELYRLSNHEMLFSKTFPIKYTNWYHIQAEVHSDTISLWMNQFFLGQVRDNRIPTGSAGVAVQDAEVLFDDLSIRVPNPGEPRAFQLWSSAPHDGKLQFNLAQGAMVMSGQWYLELSHDLKTWQRISPFSPGNVSAFAQTAPSPADARPHYYRAALVEE
jgi:hypothetical protein